jgi:predicted MPP superfamily phosphohydrolase|tara:strand:+ start:1113 stop:2360 length:1248 start_codon:yes stop_codon:yes gene_type:complete
MNRVLFVTIFSIVFLLIDYYAFQAIKTITSNQSEGIQKVIKTIYFSFTSLVIISIVVYNFGNPDGLGKHARTMLMSFVFINVLAKLFLGLFVFIDDIQRFFRWIVMKLANPRLEAAEEGISRSKFLATTGLVVAAAPIVSLSWGIVSGAHDYRVRRIKLPVKNLPKGLEGLRIGQLSDIHSGSFWNKTAVKGGVQMFADEKVDLAFFTGDLVNNKATEMQEWGSIFSKVNAPLGVYSVFGNHDYGDYVQWETPAQKQKNLADLATIHKNMGWNLLMNEHKVIEVDGEKLGVIGVENWGAKARFPKYGRLDQAMRGLNESSVNLLLSHDPSHWQAEVLLKHKNIDLTLSGHTHGMQFGVDIPGFKWSPVQYVYDEWAGLYQSGEQYLYVNRGFGYLGYPGRVGILPEISVITLERA